jgi:uncharacterized protein (DUF2141 family)
MGSTLSLTISLAAAQQSLLTVNLNGLRSQKGSVVVCLWRQQDKAFPMCSNTVAFQQKTMAAKGSSVTVNFLNIPSGDYAISAIHDENNNGKIDRGVMGQPREGLALSNMALSQERRGRPTFNKAKFTVNGENTLSLSFRYF